MNLSIPARFDIFSFISALAIIILFVFGSCRKTDSTINKHKRTEDPVLLAKDFFQEHAPTDPTVKAVLGFVKRKNDKSDFVQKTISLIGMPYWDKAMVFHTKRQKHGSGSTVNRLTDNGNTGDSTSIVYVPFARDDQNNVNALMVIKANSSDTSFRYLCDWQYADTATIGMKADVFALLMMKMDKVVFGHDDFKITDSSIFKDWQHVPASIKIIDSISQTAPNLLTPIVYQICFITYGPWFSCGQLTGCPTGTPGCYDLCRNEISRICFDGVIWQDEGDDYGGTGDSNGDSGGSSGGGSTPPECPGATTNGRNMPCEPGWEPEPVEEDPAISYVLNNLVVSPPINEDPLDLNDYLKCFVNSLGSTYKVTISSDQPSPGQSDCYTNNNGNIDVGHTFLTFEQTKPDGSIIRRSFGFYPSSGVKPITPTSTGIFVKDENHISDASLTTTIADGGLFMEKISWLRNLQSQGSGVYHLSLFNCTTFATIVANSFGETIPLQSCFWAKMGNPGDLGQYIRNMQLKPNQTRNLQTVTAPFNSGGC